MKQKKMTIIAVVSGLACAACVGLFMASVQGQADSARSEALARFGGEQVEAYVATRDIVAGERVDLSAVESRLWVADLLPENAVRASSDAVGKTATSPIFKGEVITSGRFNAAQGSLDVPAGKQAVSVPAKAVQAVGGAVHPGMSVDVYSSGDSTTAAIATNVNVLDASVGASGSLTSSDNGWITLAVDPDKVQEIIAASNKTTLYFTLPGDRDAFHDNDPGNADSEGAQSAEESQEGEATDRKKNAKTESKSSSSASSEKASKAASGSSSSKGGSSSEGGE